MGCSEMRPRKDYSLKSEEILTNIDNLFNKMLIRSIPVTNFSEKVISYIASKETSDIEQWKNFVKEKLQNIEYNQTIQDFVNKAFEESKMSYGDESLPLISLLFLAESDKNKFLLSFKALNIAKKTKNAGNDLMKAINSGMQGGIIAGIVSGLGAIQNVAGAVNQVSNPNMIRKYDLKNLLLFYVNFITLLSVNILDTNKEGNKMEKYYASVLNNAFDIKLQRIYVEENFFKYCSQEEISLEEFFGEHLINLKADKDLRKALLDNYIKTLSKEDIRKIKYGY